MMYEITQSMLELLEETTIKMYNDAPGFTRALELGDDIRSNGLSPMYIYCSETQQIFALAREEYVQLLKDSDAAGAPKQDA